MFLVTSLLFCVIRLGFIVDGVDLVLTNCLMGQEFVSVGLALLSGLERGSMGRYRRGHSSLRTIGVNVNAGRCFIPTRVICVGDKGIFHKF